jgi:hypothetical protein
MRAYVTFWSERPDAPRVCMLEVMAAGSEALAHRERTMRSRLIAAATTGLLAGGPRELDGAS